MSNRLCLWEVRDLKSLELASIDVDNSKFRQRPRMGHLLQSTQSRFTLSHKQGTRRERSGRAISSQCLVGGTLRDWLDRKAPRVAGSSSPDYERRFRASERLFSMGMSRIPNHHHQYNDEFTIVKQSCKSLGDRARYCNEEDDGRDSVSCHRVGIHAGHAVDQELDISAWKSRLSQVLLNTRMP